MAQIKLRIELNKGRTGAPLEKLGCVARQMERFLRALGADLNLETKRGEWLAINFKNGSVAWDATYQNDVTDAQFRRFNHLLVIISGGSALVASKVIGEKPEARDILALIVAICSALLAALQPQQRARAYRQAWIELDLAIKASEGTPTELIEALRRGENLIGDTHAEKAEEPKPK
jgi:hypothetical protein